MMLPKGTSTEWSNHGKAVAFEPATARPSRLKAATMRAACACSVIAVTVTGGEQSVHAFPGGVRALWKRDDLGRLSERHVLTGANTAEQKCGDDVMRQGYAWRSAEQLAGLQDLLSGSSRQFAHDVRGNLVQETRYPRHGQPQHPATQYRLADKVGNLFRTTDHSDAEYAPGGALKRWGSNTYEYDDAGRLTTKTLADGGVWRYRWSPTGRLLTVKRPDGKAVAFDYDALGRRTQKCFEGVVTSYVWDGNDLVHAQVRRADGTCAPMMTWAHEPGSFSPLVHQVGRERYAVVADHLGTPQMLTDEQGRVAWQAQLDVYGVPIDEAGEVGQPWRWPGQLFDEETGLCYNRHRYYDPECGQYISEDPIGLLGGLALHGYVHDPMGWIDPLGLVKGPPLRVGEAGRFGDLDSLTRKRVGDGLTPHHMPQDGLGFLSRNAGGTIVMPHAEHILTRTYGGRGVRTKRLDANLSFRSVLAKDILDLRKHFGPKYNSGIKQLLDYYRQHYPELMAKTKIGCVS